QSIETVSLGGTGYARPMVAGVRLSAPSQMELQVLKPGRQLPPFGAQARGGKYPSRLYEYGVVQVRDPSLPEAENSFVLRNIADRFLLIEGYPYPILLDRANGALESMGVESDPRTPLVLSEIFEQTDPDGELAVRFRSEPVPGRFPDYRVRRVTLGEGESAYPVVVIVPSEIRHKAERIAEQLVGSDETGAREGLIALFGPEQGLTKLKALKAEKGAGKNDRVQIVKSRILDWAAGQIAGYLASEEETAGGLREYFADPQGFVNTRTLGTPVAALDSPRFGMPGSSERAGNPAALASASGLGMNFKGGIVDYEALEENWIRDPGILKEYASRIQAVVDRLDGEWEFTAPDFDRHRGSQPVVFELRHTDTNKRVELRLTGNFNATMATSRDGEPEIGSFVIPIEVLWWNTRLVGDPAAPSLLIRSQLANELQHILDGIVPVPNQRIEHGVFPADLETELRPLARELATYIYHGRRASSQEWREARDWLQSQVQGAALRADLTLRLAYRLQYSERFGTGQNVEAIMTHLLETQRDLLKEHLRVLYSARINRATRAELGLSERDSAILEGLALSGGYAAAKVRSARGATEDQMPGLEHGPDKLATAVLRRHLQQQGFQVAIVGTETRKVQHDEDEQFLVGELLGSRDGVEQAVPLVADVVDGSLNQVRGEGGASSMVLWGESLVPLPCDMRVAVIVYEDDEQGSVTRGLDALSGEEARDPGRILERIAKAKGVSLESLHRIEHYERYQRKPYRSWVGRAIRKILGAREPERPVEEVESPGLVAAAWAAGLRPDLDREFNEDPHSVIWGVVDPMEAQFAMAAVLKNARLKAVAFPLGALEKEPGVLVSEEDWPEKANTWNWQAPRALGLLRRNPNRDSAVFTRFRGELEARLRENGLPKREWETLTQRSQDFDATCAEKAADTQDRFLKPEDFFAVREDGTYDVTLAVTGLDAQSSFQLGGVYPVRQGLRVESLVLKDGNWSRVEQILSVSPELVMSFVEEFHYHMGEAQSADRAGDTRAQDALDHYEEALTKLRMAIYLLDQDEALKAELARYVPLHMEEHVFEIFRQRLQAMGLRNEALAGWKSHLGRYTVPAAASMRQAIQLYEDTRAFEMAEKARRELARILQASGRSQIGRYTHWQLQAWNDTAREHFQNGLANLRESAQLYLDLGENAEYREITREIRNLERALSQIQLIEEGEQIMKQARAMAQGLEIYELYLRGYGDSPPEAADYIRVAEMMEQAADTRFAPALSAEATIDALGRARGLREKAALLEWQAAQETERRPGRRDLFPGVRDFTTVNPARTAEILAGQL
ncbi:MAG: hypothetical protein JW937_06350, partial [Candidatus Omnitrophica bacterium]|nr:hypothetical protein [Candidatus Omnitrophota bacterium]